MSGFYIYLFSWNPKLGLWRILKAIDAWRFRGKTLFPNLIILYFHHLSDSRMRTDLFCNFKKCQTKVTGHLKGNGNSTLVFHRDNNCKTLLCVSDTSWKMFSKDSSQKRAKYCQKSFEIETFAAMFSFFPKQQDHLRMNVATKSYDDNF